MVCTPCNNKSYCKLYITVAKSDKDTIRRILSDRAEWMIPPIFHRTVFENIVQETAHRKAWIPMRQLFKPRGPRT